MRALMLMILWLVSGNSYGVEENLGGHEITEITVSCDLLHGSCHKDGSGLYFELLRAVYGLDGIKVNYRIDPFIRGIKLVEEQRVDLIPAALKLPAREQRFTFPNIRVSTEYISVLRHIDTPAIDDHQYDTHVTTIRGYEYSKFISPIAILKTVSNTNQGIRMIIARRSDYFINSLYDTYLAMTELANQEVALDLKDYKLEVIDSSPTYLLFQKNQRGRKLADIYDRNFKILYEQGKIKEIFYQREIDRAYYNFPEMVGYDQPPPELNF